MGMPTGSVLRIALQVMSAMGAAAFHKISHHAINPANLLLVPGQTPEGDWFGRQKSPSFQNIMPVGMQLIFKDRLNLESQGVFALSPNNFQDRFVTAGLSESN